MDKKGFTLVELVATIAIMLLVTTIAVPSIISIVNKNEDKLDSATKKQLIAYAKSYVKENNFTIEKNKTYCVLVSNLTDTEIKDSENNAVTGRIEIKNQNDKINYTYNTINDMNGCSEFSSGNIELKNDQISLKSNDNPTIDPDSMLGKLVEKYEVNPTVPDFKLKSPKNLDGGSGDKRELIREKLTSEELTWRGMVTFYPVYEDGTPQTNRVETPYDNETEMLWKGNTKAYFGDGYTFDQTTGNYILTNPEKNYMYIAVENGKKYACRSSDNYTCSTMYEIEEYSHTKGIGAHPSDGGGDYRYFSYMDLMQKGKVYTSIPDIDPGDSGLYRTIDKDGYTYYFRGAITNNYVKLGDTLFQILRFNGDGSIRLVAVDSIGTINIGTNDNSIYYNGYYTVPTYNVETSDGVLHSISYTEISTSITTSYPKISDNTSITLFNNIQIDNKYKSSSKFSVDGKSEITAKECYEENSLCVGKYVYYYYYRTAGGNILSTSSKDTLSQIKSIVKNGNSYTLKVSDVSTKYSGENKNSVLKTRIENWYNTYMIDYDSLIVNGRFCNDVGNTFNSSNTLYPLWGSDYSGSFSGTDECTVNYSAILYSPFIRLNYDQDSINPSYICNNINNNNNGGEYLLKVGTLTADDVVFAGGISGYSFSYDNSSKKSYTTEEFKANSNNNDFFLYRENGFITLSKIYKNNIYSLSTNTYADMPVGNSPAYLDVNSSSEDVYPVINIRGDIKFTGNGTKNDPYVIDTDQSHYNN